MYRKATNACFYCCVYNVLLILNISILAAMYINKIPPILIAVC